MASPNELTTIPKKSGLFASVTESPTIHRAFWNNPVAPTPDTARPNINTGEFGAAAHSTDPTYRTHLSAESREWGIWAYRTFEERD